jgi:hypothetical protein
MSKDINTALIRAGFLPVSNSNLTSTDDGAIVAPVELGTILGNMAYYGFAPSSEALTTLTRMPREALIALWEEIDPVFGYLTGDARKMNDEIIYQNFPREVLDMSEASYWVRQICMYVGIPKAFFTEEPKDRAPLSETTKLKILSSFDINTAATLYQKLVSTPFTWSDAPFEDALILQAHLGVTEVDFAGFAAKANAAQLAAAMFEDRDDVRISLTTPVDALRLISLLCGGDVRLSTPFKAKSLKRSLRRTLVRELDAMGSEVLAEAFAQRRNLWKQVLMRLHPGDYQAPDLNAAYDLLYRSQARGLEAQIAIGIADKNKAALGLAATRPGVFARRLRHLHSAFGREAFEAFVTVLPKLTVLQMARLERIFATLKTRSTRLYTPKGQFSKAKVVPAPQVNIPNEDIAMLREALMAEITTRLDAAHPEGFDVNPDVDTIKIAMNGQELSPYGRGTRFDIPHDVNFIRSMSYWETEDSYDNVWFDNGWNFFDAQWNSVGVLSWDNERFGSTGENAAIFSGDPVSSQSEGKGAQAIDLYLDRLKEQGVRYAIWSTLCYSGIPFSKAGDVFACLQWGEDAQAGEVFDPSRAQMAFPLKSDALTNVTALVDLDTRELVYLDAALPLNTQSAGYNQERLSQYAPALMDVIDAQPSVSGILGLAKSGITPVLRNDEDAAVTGTAFVFERRNAESQIEPLDLDALLKA